LKFVATLSPKRQRLVPEVPSTTESQALKHFTAEIGTGYFVKQGTPEATVQALHKALQKAMDDTRTKAALFALGQDMAPPQSLADAARSYQNEIATYQAIAKSIGLAP
jgi:tripartite-type tricarboxylate transporter receptor subunit TctC